ncbi:MAG: hypothetical protein AAGC60_00810 [Acidobacteriota bacterium]
MTVPPRDEHPSVEQLCAYSETEAPAPGHDRIAEHLVACDECADIVLGFEAMDRAALEPAADHDVDARWRSFQEVLDAEDSASRVAAFREPTARDRSVVSDPRIAWVAAAAATLVALGLGIWGVSLDREMRRPHAELRIHDVISREAATIRGAAGTRIEVPASADLVLLFNLASTTAPEVVALRAFDVRGREVLALDDIERSRDGNYVVSLPAGWLGGGSYRVDLIETGSGVEATETTETAATYRFDLELVLLDAEP